MDTDTDLDRALAFYQPPPESWYSGIHKKIEATGQWIWETIQGDFNDNQSTGQVVTGTVISMIPLVDQICDVRDLVANCMKIKEGNDKKTDTTWAWVAMILTLVGLIPVAGSLIKGIFKVLFNSIRKAALAGKITLKAIDAAVSLFNRFIDMTVVQATMKYMKIYNPYQYAEKQVRELIAQLNVSVLLTKFDELMEVTGSLLDKAKSWGPESIRQPIETTWKLLVSIRSQANTMLEKALAPLNETLEKLAARLRQEGDNYYKAHTGANPHRPTRLKDAEEAEFMALKSKSQWRRRFAVWKSWNENGEYVVYTVPPGTTMKVWEGPAASQSRSVTDNGKNVDIVLEGGGIQIVIDPADLNLNYLGKRQHTGWGYRDFSDEVDMYIGIPQLQTKIFVPEE